MPYLETLEGGFEALDGLEQLELPSRPVFVVTH
jgi:hypothetical protein